MIAGEVDTAVLLAERGALTAARVAAREGSRYVLVNVAGERFAVNAARLFWAGRAAVPDDAALAGYWAEVQALAHEADLAAAWQRLEREGGAGDDIATVARLALRGRATDDAVAGDAIAAAVFSDTTWFRMRERTLVRESAAEVEATLKKRAEKAAAQRKLGFAVEAYAARLRDRAKLGAQGLHTPEPADESAEGIERAAAIAEYRAALVDVAAKGRESPQWALVLPLCEALNAPADKCFELLVRLGELEPTTNLAPYRAGIPLAFEPEVLAEADRLAAHRPATGADLTRLVAIAIDDADTTDVDDAMAIEGARVYVFISDAAAWVTPGGIVDRAAAERTATVYLPEGKLPMLPAVLSDGPMSLLCEGIRSALAFSFELAPDGRLTGFELTRARVKIARRMTYDEGDAVLRDPSSDALGPTLAKIAAEMDRHRAWRNARGAVQFQRPEVYFDATGERVKLKIGDPLGPARQLVQELMVATCTGAAIFCAEQQIPCVYRAQAPPDDAPKVADPRTGRIEDANLQYELLRRLKPSTLQLEAAPHFTLGVPAYTQVTSPIRRYADLLMHQQLSAFLKTGRPLFPANKLQAHLFELSRRAMLVRRVEQDSRRYYALRYLEQNPGMVLTGTVLREVGKKTLLELQPLALQELVPLRRRRPPGTVLRFEAIAADARADEVQLKELASP